MIWNCTNTSLVRIMVLLHPNACLKRFGLSTRHIAIQTIQDKDI